MSEAIQTPRRFTEVEVQQVFRRAAELQRRDALQISELGALSLRELEQIAADAGMDVGKVHRAIAELDSRQAGSGPHLLGAPGQVYLERVVDGEIPTAAFESLAAEIRRSLRQAGQVSLVGETRTWTAPNTSSGPVEVTISRATGRTQIGLSARFGGLLGATYGGIGAGLGIGLGMPLAGAIGQLAQSEIAAVGTAVATLGLALLLARSVYTTIVRRRIRLLKDLFSRLCDLAAAAQPRSGT